MLKRNAMLKQLFENKCFFCQSKLDCLAGGCSLGFIISTPTPEVYGIIKRQAKCLGYNLIFNWSQYYNRTAIRINCFNKDIGTECLEFYRRAYPDYIFIDFY